MLAANRFYSASWMVFVIGFSMTAPRVSAEPTLEEIFEARGFSVAPDAVELPEPSARFPIERLKTVRFRTVAEFEWFPEGPSYRADGNDFFFAGHRALTRVGDDGSLHEVMGEPGAGGTHFLPDGSVLIVGRTGLRRLFPDGRIALLADGQKIGGGNDLSVGIHGEIYFSVPKAGIYRLTPGKNGRLERVVEKGCNGLEVDPAGKFLYVVRATIERYPLDINQPTLGDPETVYRFPKGEGGGDGCSFDAWGHLYSMHFRTGTIRVFDPATRTILATVPVGVVPATNLTFGGPTATELFVTAGAPKFENCCVLRTNLGITGFCGHSGATDYPIVRWLDERGNVEALSRKEKL